jgi:DNA repair protein RadC
MQITTEPKMPSSSLINDTHVREIRVSYLPTQQERFQINGPECVARFFRMHQLDNSREQVMALYLDGSHSVISYSVISIGHATSAPVHPREILQRAILSGSVSFLLAHNHPSGSTKPSSEDLWFTQKMVQAAEFIGIRLIDHVIVTDFTSQSLSTTHASCWVTK